PDYRVQRTWHHRARTCLLRHVVAQWPFGAQCADLLQDERSHSGTEPPLFATQGRQWRALRKEPALSTPDAKRVQDRGASRPDGKKVDRIELGFAPLPEDCRGFTREPGHPGGDAPL